MVQDRVGDIDVNAANGIDHAGEAVEIDLYEGMDRDAKVCLNGANHESGPAALHIVVIAQGESGVDLVDSVSGDHHLDVARNREDSG